MADYDFRPGGSLKLKGGVADGGIVKRCVSTVFVIQCT
jgi:protein FAM32A